MIDHVGGRVNRFSNLFNQHKFTAKFFGDLYSKNRNDFLNINKNDKIAYVTQTTLSVDDTKSIIKEIKKKYPNVIEPRKDDICYATTNRQEAVKDTATRYRGCLLYVYFSV